MGNNWLANIQYLRSRGCKEEVKIKPIALSGSKGSNFTIHRHLLLMDTLGRCDDRKGIYEGAVCLCIYV